MVRSVHSPLDRSQNHTHVSSSASSPSLPSDNQAHTSARNINRVTLGSGEGSNPFASGVVYRLPSTALSHSGSLSPLTSSSLSTPPSSPSSSLSSIPSISPVRGPPPVPSFWHGTSFTSVLRMQRLQYQALFLCGLAVLLVIGIGSMKLYNRPVRTPIVGSSTPHDDALKATTKPSMNRHGMGIPDDAPLNLKDTEDTKKHLDQDLPSFPFESALEKLLAVLDANRSSSSSFDGAPSADSLRTFHKLVIDDYLKFHRKANSPTTSHNCKHTKCLIARVDQSPTHGLGDRMRGIVTSYFLAVMTRRVFMIEWKTPLPVAHALYPWTSKTELIGQDSLRASSAWAVGPKKMDGGDSMSGKDKHRGSRPHAIDDGIITVNNFTYSFIGDDPDFVLDDYMTGDFVRKIREHTARLTSTKCCCCRYPLTPTITMSEYDDLRKEQREKGEGHIPLFDTKTGSRHFRLITNGNLYHTEHKYANVHTLYMDSVPAPNVTRWFQPPLYRKARNKLLKKLSILINLRDAVAMTSLHVIPLILQAIFTPSQALRARIAELMPPALKRTGLKGYIAVHARLGYGLEEEAMDASRFNLESKGLSVKAMAECFAWHVVKLANNPNSGSDIFSSDNSPSSRSSSNGNGWSKISKRITVFVATDTPQFRTMFAEAMVKVASDLAQGNQGNMSTANVMPSFHVVTMHDLVPVHIRDITKKQADYAKAVNDLLDTFVDLFLLGHATTLVHLESGFSDLAMWMGCSTSRVVVSRDTCAERYGIGIATVKAATHDTDGYHI